MYRDDHDFYMGQRRPSLISYVAAALIGAVIGGMIVAFVTAGLFDNPTKLNTQEKRLLLRCRHWKSHRWSGLQRKLVLLLWE